MNMSADALFGRPVVCKPMEFGKSSDRVKTFCNYSARSVFQDDDLDLFNP
jgi:hypothetical protein